jgi:hypothetical protein
MQTFISNGFRLNDWHRIPGFSVGLVRDVLDPEQGLGWQQQSRFFPGIGLHHEQTSPNLLYGQLDERGSR